MFEKTLFFLNIKKDGRKTKRKDTIPQRTQIPH